MLETLHIEPTSRCVLACPACPRTSWTEITKKRMPKNDLSIDDFLTFLDCDAGKYVKDLRLCGDYGDPIYYPELLKFIDTFRHKNIIIHTNGSSQKSQLWRDLASRLTNNDTIIFGIDGLYDDNVIYRKNANWDSIMMAIDTIRNYSDAKIKWQTIIFKFNQNKISEIKDFAESKGAEFYTIPTHRFGDDNLVPDDDENIEVEFLYKDDYHSNSPMDIEPKCIESMTVGSDGIFYPCDWIRNPMTFYRSPLWKNKPQWIDRLNIASTKLDQAIEIVKEWKNFVIESGLNGSAEVLCKMKCRKGACG